MTTVETEWRPLSEVVGSLLSGLEPRQRKAAVALRETPEPGQPAGN